MTNPEEIHKKARHILYLLVSEQSLRAGEGLDPQALQHDLDRHQFSAQDQQQALAYAREQGWLQTGPNGEVQLTEKGFALD
ncbi:hypothetical protein HNP33_000300 [Comamonas odontotermitis]|uniref:Uncharacterized protein n=1 Tax=Comamonas odontotermitis TaxID=379895 RepID=A0ABR6RAT5_9BURK|nr:hypothetical protein [Comamonas odontotermitis]MBB6576252.1 hypothetical protein [Comamonas odontotermitis]